MRLLQVIFLGSMMLLGACVSRNMQSSEPIYGRDIQKIKIFGNTYSPIYLDSEDYDGIYFSKFYLNSYLQWKCKNNGKC